MPRKQRGRDLTDPQNETLRAELAKVSPKMTQKALAKILGVDQSNVSKFMSGAQGISISSALRLCAHLGLDPRVLGIEVGVERYVEPEERNEEVAIAFKDARAAGVSPETIDAARARLAQYRGAEPTREDVVKALKAALDGGRSRRRCRR